MPAGSDGRRELMFRDLRWIGDRAARERGVGEESRKAFTACGEKGPAAAGRGFYPWPPSSEGDRGGAERGAAELEW